MTSFFSTNWFDLAIYVCLFVAVVMGFITGLLRSLATIFGYYRCGNTQCRARSRPHGVAARPRYG